MISEFSLGTSHRAVSVRSSTATQSCVGAKIAAEKCPRICLNVENTGHCARDCRSIATVGEGETGEDDWTWNAQKWDAQQLGPETGSTIGELRSWVLPVVKRTHRTLNCAQQRFELVLELKYARCHLTQQATIPESVARREPCEVQQKNRGRHG